MIKNLKSLTDGSIKLLKMRPKIKIDTIGIDPPPIVSSYNVHEFIERHGAARIALF
jgi:hypothetical protein